MTAPIPPTARAELFCPHCNYNLSYTESPRCPECGEPFDPAHLAVSQIPWVHRKQIGRIRAYFRTLRLVALHPKKLSAEISRPPLYPDANRFRWLNILLTLVPIYFTAYFLLSDGTRPPLALHPDIPDYSVLSIDSRLTIWPFYALVDNMYFFAAIFGGALALGLIADTALLRWWFWMFAGERKKRASTLACYLTAGLPFLAITACIDGFVAAYFDPRPTDFLTMLAVLLPVYLLNGLVPIWILSSTLRLFHRTTGSSVFKTTFTAVALPITAAILLPVTALLLDYLAGFFAFVYAGFAH